MRRLRVAGALIAGFLVVSGCGADPAGGDFPSYPPAAVSATQTTSDAEQVPTEIVVYLPAPYILRTEWVETAVGPSLQVYPTDAGRRVTDPAAQGRAWREVIAKSSRYGRFSASSPGMRAQFDCHWVWARAAAPDKPSWNLEPGRPVVTADQMVAERCNPGMAEE